MKLNYIRLSNFQSFGEKPTTIIFDEITYLIGPNGSGKTAALQALCRLFAFDPSKRRILKSDFHVPFDETEVPDERKLWIEVDFEFPELQDEVDNNSVPPNFAHMRLDTADGIPRVRFRLDATLGVDDDIEENFVYVLDVDSDDEPLNSSKVPRSERNIIHVHYLPGRRDPADHITYSTNALLGRLLRAVQWTNERDLIKGLTDQISSQMASNPSIESLSQVLSATWKKLHKGNFFSDPKITFINSEIEALLRHMSVSFAPGHSENLVDFSRLSDGQKSMLYLSLVLSTQAIGRNVLSGKEHSFDPIKLKPPVFTLVAIEEPENSLSPHYLGRIASALNAMTEQKDAQAVIATHTPSMLRRVDSQRVRYFRLDENRNTKITTIHLPADTDEAHKYVREAVQAFPEVYFSRLVVLGEGDSEEIVLPRLLQVKGAPVDESAVTIAPLGGRHVNHFWRLLAALQIPYLTLLDLDVARYAAGWGRIKNANDQLAAYEPSKVLPADHVIPHWKDATHKVRDYSNYLEALEERGVYFSYPMDLDFAMLLSFPEAYRAEEEEPDDSTIKAVLGKSHHDANQYTKAEQKLFNTYHHRCKLGSKPAAHTDPLAQPSAEQLLADMPASLSRLADAVIAKLAELPE